MADSKPQNLPFFISSSRYSIVTRGVAEPQTDQMSNAMLLDHEDVRNWIKIDKTGSLPLSDRTLRLLLHELTHHATFAGVVGNTLAALWVSTAGRAAFFPPTKEQGAISQHERDDLVARFSFQFIEPLVEGMALFAENDVTSGEDDLASHAILHLHGLFKDHRMVAQDAIAATKDADRKLNARLSTARSSAVWIEHKARLLSQPICGNHQGASYLLGYLATKRLFINMQSKSESTDKSDLFLYMMIGYWFGDLNLSEKLLAFQTDNDVIQVQKTLSAIVDRVYDLFDGLRMEPNSSIKDFFANLVAFEETDSMSGVGLLMNLRVAPETINLFVPRFIKHRLILRLGFLRVDIDCLKAESEAIVYAANGGELLFSCPSTKLAGAGRYPGSVEIVRTYDGGVTALCVIGPTGLVAVRSIYDNHWNRPVLVELFDDLPSIEMSEAAQQDLARNPRAFCWDDEYKEVNDHSMDQAILARDHLFLQAAFPHAPDHEVIRTSLGKSGFAKLFPNEKDLNRVAMYSLLFGGSGQSTAVVGDKLKATARQIERDIEEFNLVGRSELGIILFEKNNEKFVSCI